MKSLKLKMHRAIEQYNEYVKYNPKVERLIKETTYNEIRVYKHHKLYIKIRTKTKIEKIKYRKCISLNLDSKNRYKITLSTFDPRRP